MRCLPSRAAGGTSPDSAAAATAPATAAAAPATAAAAPALAAGVAASTRPPVEHAARRRYNVVVQSNADPYYAMSCLLQRPQPFAPPGFKPGKEAFQRLQDTRVLVVGAGGLGCELLKCLCLSGFKRISVLDMDVVHVSNLHRQFLFREQHVGKYKAHIAAAVLNSKYAPLGVVVESHVCRMEEKNEGFYRQFHLVLSGLDSIEGRRWLNSMLHSLVKRDENGELDAATCIPLLDGGTEGLKGQARFIFPHVTSCFECSLDSFPPQRSYPLCTIAETPRLPEHCVEYAMLVQWPKEHPRAAFDSDNVRHLEWLFKAAERRANAFGIHGVDYSLTLGVAKRFQTYAADCSGDRICRIIPAVVSTNAVIAAILVEAATKIATGCLCSTHDFTIAAASAQKHMEEEEPTAAAAKAQLLLEDTATRAHLNEEAAGAEATTAATLSVFASKGEEAAADFPFAQRARIAVAGSSSSADTDFGVLPAAAQEPLSLHSYAQLAGAAARSTASAAGATASLSIPKSGGGGAAVEEGKKKTALADVQAARANAAGSSGGKEKKKDAATPPPPPEAAAAGAAVAEENEEEEVLSGIQNYVMYMAEAGIYTNTFEYGKKPDCVVCSRRVLTKRVAQPEKETLQSLLDFLAADSSLRLQKPSITGPRGIVFLQHPPQLRRIYEVNLGKSFRELQAEGLLDEGEELAVTDPLLTTPLRLRLLLS